MNHDSLSSDSLEEQNFISRASPKTYEQPGRSRFSILSDINEANALSRKTEEQSLLSKYMKDLHEEQVEQPTKTNSQGNYRSTGSEASRKEEKKKESLRNRQLNEYDWKRKNGVHCQVNSFQSMNKSKNSAESSRNIKRQDESYGIFTYKMKIDLNAPIDFHFEEQENIHRNNESRNNSKNQKEDLFKTDDMLFGKALLQRNKNNHIKNGKH